MMNEKFRQVVEPLQLKVDELLGMIPMSVSVRMGTTFSGQWVPPERLRRESFEGAVREG